MTTDDDLDKLLAKRLYIKGADPRRSKVLGFGGAEEAHQFDLWLSRPFTHDEASAFWYLKDLYHGEFEQIVLDTFEYAPERGDEARLIVGDLTWAQFKIIKPRLVEFVTNVADTARDARVRSDAEWDVVTSELDLMEWPDGSISPDQR